MNFRRMREQWKSETESLGSSGRERHRGRERISAELGEMPYHAAHGKTMDSRCKIIEDSNCQIGECTTLENQQAVNAGRLKGKTFPTLLRFESFCLQRCWSLQPCSHFQGMSAIRCSKLFFGHCRGLLATALSSYL